MFHAGFLHWPALPLLKWEQGELEWTHRTILSHTGGNCLIKGRRWGPPLRLRRKWRNVAVIGILGMESRESFNQRSWKHCPEAGQAFLWVVLPPPAGPADLMCLSFNPFSHPPCLTWVSLGPQIYQALSYTSWPSQMLFAMPRKL